MKYFALSLLMLLLAACSPQVPVHTPLIVTAIPTAQPAEICNLPFSPDPDWALVTAELEKLLQAGISCSGPSLSLRLYYAYLNYGQMLENAGQSEQAVSAYQTAASYHPSGQEAQRRLAALPPSPVPAPKVEPICSETQTALPDYQPLRADFVTLEENHLSLNGTAFTIYGVNYYPQKTPFGLFLTQTSLAEIRPELELIRASGINTLRVFLHYDDLFTCDETAPAPIADAFTILDHLIAQAAALNLRLILVLHHAVAPARLYTEQAVIYRQTAFIVSRYRDEAAVLAWDLRDHGDSDYREQRFTRQQVLTWLADTAVLVRSLDSNHPITAGWWQDAAITKDFVDFVSFQFFGDYAELRQELANLRAQLDKPALLAAVGYSTFELDETVQRNLLYQVFEEIQYNGLQGWIVYTAFDYPRTATCIPPDCPGSGAPVNHYGLWNISYFPKLAVDAVEIITGVEQRPD